MGTLKTPWSMPNGSENNAAPAARSALAATTPVPDPVQSKQTAAIGALALTAPDTLEGKAGQDTAFAIALDHTGDLPAPSIIAISGLPQGATLSSGRPYGETEWNLRPDEIGDLRLALPTSASGETKLRVKLVAPDGEIVAGTETVLKVASDPEASLVASHEDSEPQFEFDPAGTLAPQVIYDQDLIGIGAWDEQSRQRLAATGVEERLTTPDTPAPPPGEVLRLPDAEPAKASNDPPRTKWIEPSTYVNLRDGPTASASVISIVPKGTKLSVLGRKRGWVKVTNPATSESGWVYAGNIVGSAKPKRGAKRGTHSKASVRLLKIRGRPGSARCWAASDVMVIPAGAPNHPESPFARPNRSPWIAQFEPDGAPRPLGGDTTLDHMHRSPVFCGAGLPPSVGDASLAGSNEPCLNATRHVMPCCSPSHHEYPGVEEVLFVPP